MSEKILLYGLSFMTIGLAAGLLIARNMMIARLSDEQIRLIFKEERHTEVELGTINRTLLKLRTHYPSLLFLIVGTGLAFLAFIRVTDTTDWLVKGQFVLPQSNGSGLSPDWKAGILTIFPTDVRRVTVRPSGSFLIEASIPSNETFESKFKYFSFVTPDERYHVEVFPKQELERFGAGNEMSLLKQADNGLRIYGDVQVSELPGTKDVID
jgi:hypothetical protein